MPRVTFENGQSVFFEKQPSEADIEEVYAQISKPKPMFSSVEEANAAMQQANQAQELAKYQASGVVPYLGMMSSQDDKVGEFLAKNAPSVFIGGGVGNTLVKPGAGMLRNILGNAASGFAGGATADASSNEERLRNAAIATGVGAVGGAILGKINPVKIDDKILETYSKAINPSISRVKNATTLNEFKTKTPQAMKAIANNADNIQFTDEATGVVENRLPKSRIEAFEALKQTKQSIFDKYNSLTKDAADKGATVNVYEAAKKSFDNITNSRQFSLYEPKLKQEASSILKRIEKTGKALSSPEEVEKDIQFLNQKMQGYYKKGDYNASNIYASYAGNLREALDNSIEKALNQKGYQQLKNEYSSLKFVEKDLAQAAARQLKQVDPKLGDGITDPLAIMEMARGILTSNPSSFASGLALKSVVNLRKYLNNPDLKIKLMFEQIKKSKK